MTSRIFRQGLWLLLLCGVAAGAAAQQTTLVLTPTPRQVTPRAGAFAFTADMALVTARPDDPDDAFAAGGLADEIDAAFGFRPPVGGSGAGVLLGRVGRDAAVDAALAAAGITVPDGIGDEGYVLHVAPSGVVVAARGAAGVFYGVQTLRQLVRANRTGNTIPAVTITDWPGLRYRGWMDDISRGPIPTLAFLKEVVREMAALKQNYLTLYTEHTFRLRSHPDIAPAEGITAAEIAALEAFARPYHVEVVGNYQSFGHMEKMLQIPFYRPLGENPWVLSPAVEGTYGFLGDAYAEVAPAYRSRLFNINADEVGGLGEGPARRMVDTMGVDGVYAYHINRVYELLRPYDKRLMMWGDIAVNNPRIIDRLPRDLIILSWGYDPRESFDDAITPFTSTGFEFMVAPGVGSWSLVYPNLRSAVVNIANYVRDGARHGALGMMNTAWDDDGETLFNYNWHGLAWGAEMSWAPLPPRTGDGADAGRAARLSAFNDAFDRVFFAADGVSPSRLLFRLDSLRTLPVRGAMTDEAQWADPLRIYPDDVSDAARRGNEALREAGLRLAAEIDAARARVRRNAGVLDYAAFAARRAAFLGEKNLAKAALSRVVDGGGAADVAAARTALDGAARTLHDLKQTYVNLWMRENRSWWLDRVLDRYDRLGRQLTTVGDVVRIEPAAAVRDGRREIRLRTLMGDRPIYYTTDGSEPGTRSPRYTGPFRIDRSSLVRARVIENDQPLEMAEQFVGVHRAVGALHRLNARYSRYNLAYTAGGDLGLVDGLKGSTNFADGRWQGYQGQDLDLVLDLGRRAPLHRFSMSFLQNSYSWILMPASVEVLASDDGRTFRRVADIPNPVDPKAEGTIIRDFEASLDGVRARYLRVVAKSVKVLPEWHHAAGGEAFLFADEVVVE